MCHWCRYGRREKRVFNWILGLSVKTLQSRLSCSDAHIPVVYFQILFLGTVYRKTLKTFSKIFSVSLFEAILFFLKRNVFTCNKPQKYTRLYISVHMIVALLCLQTTNAHSRLQAHSVSFVLLPLQHPLPLHHYNHRHSRFHSVSSCHHTHQLINYRQFQPSQSSQPAPPPASPQPPLSKPRNPQNSYFTQPLSPSATSPVHILRPALKLCCILLSYVTSVSVSTIDTETSTSVYFWIRAETDSSAVSSDNAANIVYNISILRLSLYIRTSTYARITGISTFCTWCPTTTCTYSMTCSVIHFILLAM